MLLRVQQLIRFSIVIAIFTLFDVVFLPSHAPVYATNIDLNSAANYNIRIDGSSASATAGLFYKDLANDIDANGKNDMVLCERKDDYNGRTNSGSCYIIYDSILDSLSATGAVLDLSDSTKWNIRFDGAAEFDNLGYVGTSAADFDGNGRLDLVLKAGLAEKTRERSGAVYIIKDSIFRNITGTGNTIDLNVSTNYSIRYDGATSPCEIGESFAEGVDINNNGQEDLILGSGHCGLGGRSRSGALYIIYDSLLSTITGTGNIIDLATASNFNVVFYEDTGSYFTILNSLVTKDINNNGKLDIMAGLSNADKNGRTDSGSVIVIYDDIIDNFAGTGNYVDLTDTANFNLRYDGAAEYDYFGSGVLAADVDNSGKLDFIFGVSNADNNSRAESGSVYVVYDSLISAATGTGNTFDMANTAKWNLRFDGATAAEYLGGYMDDSMYDYDNNGVVDLLLPSSGANYNSRAESGSEYIIYDSIIDNYSGTGNILDLANTALYSHRIDGAAAGDYFAYHTYQTDMDLDGSYDQIISAYWADPQGRTDAASVYVLYNFPHTISTTTTSRNGSNVSIAGTISAPRSTTTISGLQYKIDSNTPGSGWTNCSAQDGSFNSTSENYACSIANAPTNAGTHTVYLRAVNNLTVYTPRSRYATYVYTIGGGSASASGPKKPHLNKKEGGVVTAQLSGDSGAQSPLVILPSNSIDFDSRLDVQVTKPSQNYFDFPLGRAWFIGSTHAMWLKDFYNDAVIIQALQSKSSIITLGYSPNLLAIAGKPGTFFSESRLRLAYSADNKTWSIMSSSIIDQNANTVSAVDKIGGYYALVAISEVGGQKNTQGANQGSTQGVSIVKKTPINNQKKASVKVVKKILAKPVKKTESKSFINKIRSFFLLTLDM